MEYCETARGAQKKAGESRNSLITSKTFLEEMPEPLSLIDATHLNSIISTFFPLKWQPTGTVTRDDM